MKRIQDYLHFYFKGWGTITNSKHQTYSGGHWALSASILHAVMMNELVFTPHLRPLSDMSTNEAIELTKPVVVYGDLPNVRQYETWENPFGKIVVSWGNGLREKYVPQDESCFVPIQFRYLLQQGFDLFELIKDGLAIDATKLKTGSIA